jgi:hypothetical protein
MAQKQGWTTYLRHSGAVVYGPRGPVIVVVLTYRPKLHVEEARRLGARAMGLVERLVGDVRPAWYS